jgi:hypothetical protein
MGRRNWATAHDVVAIWVDWPNETYEKLSSLTGLVEFLRESIPSAKALGYFQPPLRATIAA